MGTPILVLDKGYVELIEPWGMGRDGVNRHPIVEGDYLGEANDYEVGIIEAARQSTQKGFQGWESDEKLLKYLYENKHVTPFEFAGMIIEVQAPIFVFREWHRHRTQSYNEMSARYAPLPDDYYLPNAGDLFARANRQTSNKQEQGARKVSRWDTEEFVQHTKELYRLIENHYKAALAVGIPKEIARIIMPVGHYSRMRASANLRNWLAFLTLRTDPKAQSEIRQFAEAVGTIIMHTFPRTWKLFHGED